MSINKSIKSWIINENQPHIHETAADKIDWLRAIPFILLNASCLLVFYFGFSSIAFTVAVILYFVRIFSIGAFYHRFFSHRAFKTNRFWQCIFALIAGMCAQRGPLWWASHHRHHHVVSDEPGDTHSPVQHGFWWSHFGWFLSKRNYYYNPANVSDLLRFPELVFLDRFDLLMPAVLFFSLFLSGFLLRLYAPELHTGPGLMLVWGFCISTVAVFNTTVLVNSINHISGKRRFLTKDNSRNNWLLALLTFGEGWHNNHHFYPSSARQGFYWWEIDVTYYIIKCLEKMGIVWDVRQIPPALLKQQSAKQ